MAQVRHECTEVTGDDDGTGDTLRAYCACGWESAPVDPWDMEQGSDTHPYDLAQQRAHELYEEHAERARQRWER